MPYRHEWHLGEKSKNLKSKIHRYDGNSEILDAKRRNDQHYEYTDTVRVHKLAQRHHMYFVCTFTSLGHRASLLP